MITFKSWVGQARCKGLPEPPAHTISVHSQGSGSAASSTPSALRWLEAGDSSRAWHPPHPLRSSVPRRCLPHPTLPHPPLACRVAWPSSWRGSGSSRGRTPLVPPPSGGRLTCCKAYMQQIAGQSLFSSCSRCAVHTERGGCPLGSMVSALLPGEPWVVPAQHAQLPTGPLPTPPCPEHSTPLLTMRSSACLLSHILQASWSRWVEWGVEVG